MNDAPVPYPAWLSVPQQCGVEVTPEDVLHLTALPTPIPPVPAGGSVGSAQPLTAPSFFAPTSNGQYVVLVPAPQPAAAPLLPPLAPPPPPAGVPLPPTPLPPLPVQNQSTLFFAPPNPTTLQQQQQHTPSNPSEPMVGAPPSKSEPSSNPHPSVEGGTCGAATTTGETAAAPKGNFRQLMVNFLEPTVTNSDLHSVFAHIGPVESARVINDPDASSSKGYGFVYYKHAHHALAAFETLNGAVIHGRAVKVSWANHRNRKKRPPVATAGGGES